MENLFLHIVLIPGMFLLGWLAHSVKVVYFQAKPIRERIYLQSREK